MEYDRTNTGIMSKNDRKEKDSHPDVKGNVNIEGVEYWLSGWKKERNDGSGSFYSLAFKRKDQQAATTDAQVDGDIPF